MNKSFILACTLTCLSASAQKANVFSISTTERHQEIDCFGASDAWSMQFFGNIAQPVQDNVARWLFSSETDAKGNPEGIALSLWRFNLGAGSAEQGDSSCINSGTRTECFLGNDGLYHWDKQAVQCQFLKKAKHFGVPYLLAFVNSPPVHFTKNHLATNTGRDGTFNLREDRYQHFARFMAEAIQGLKRVHGVEINYISPVNEPDGHWNWLGPKQEGTPATKSEIARIARLLDGELHKRQMDTRIIIPESSDYRSMMATHMTGPERGYQIQSFFSPDSTDTYVANLPHLAPLMAGHSYWTTTPLQYMKACREALRDSLKKYGAHFWQTEVCIMSNDTEIGGGHGFDQTMKTALYVARIIHHDLVLADARSWQWWRAVGGDYKDGLLFQYREPQAVADTIVDSKLLWALGHYSRFVRPKAVRLGVTKNGDTSTEKATDPNALMCSAFENADGCQVVVVINYAQHPQTVSIDGLKRGNWRVYRTSDAPNESLALVGKLQKLANITIPARSITTITNMRMK